MLWNTESLIMGIMYVTLFSNLHSRDWPHTLPPSVMMVAEKNDVSTEFE